MEGERKGYKVTQPESIDVRGDQKPAPLQPRPLCGCFRLVGGRRTPLGVGPSKPGSSGAGASYGDRSRSATRDAGIGPTSVLNTGSDQGREGAYKKRQSERSSAA
jgi:hypothetical protein